MRNLKRALSLALASVMLVGMMVVGTSAASYPDVDESKHHVEAIDVLNAVEVMIGDAGTGNFRPEDKVSRNEMAVIMAKLVLGTYEADSYVGSHPFTDVPDWADRYVAACYSAGIIAGRGEGIYDGASTVTAVEAAAMMLRALGYEDLSLGAKQWDQPVAAKANEINLFDGLSGASNTPMDRNTVAKLSLNALQATMVRTTRTGQDISLPDGTTIASVRNYTEREDVNGRDYTVAVGTDDSTLQLCEYLYDNDLKKDTTDVDEFGRPVNKWISNGSDVGSYDNASSKVVFIKETSENDVKSALRGYNVDHDTDPTTVTVSVSKTLDADVDDLVITDGNVSSPADLATTGTNAAKAISDLIGTGNGKVVEVYANSNRTITKIVVLNYAVAEVTSVTDTKDGDYRQTAYSVDGGFGRLGVVYTNPSKDSTVVLHGDVAKEDIVTFVTLTDGSDKVVHIYPTETVVGTQSARNLQKNTITVDGTVYDVATAVNKTKGGSKVVTSDFENSKDEAEYYIDINGLVVKSGEVTTSTDYAVVVAIEGKAGDINNSGVSVQAKLAFPDGSTKVVPVSKINGKKISEVGTTGTYGVTIAENNGKKTFDAVDVGAVNSTSSTKMSGRVVTYSESDGKYEINYTGLKGAGTYSSSTDFVTTYAQSKSSKNSGATTAVKVTEKGTPVIIGYNKTDASNATSPKTNNDTVFLIRTDDDEFETYTGYRNVPTITLKGATDNSKDSVATVSYDEKDGVAKFVYIDTYVSTANEAGEVGDTSTGRILYVSSTKYTEVKPKTGDTYYTLTGIVDGVEDVEIKTKTESEFSTLTAGALYELTEDSDGYITDSQIQSNATQSSTYAYAKITLGADPVSGDQIDGKRVDKDSKVYVIQDDEIVGEGPDAIDMAEEGDVMYFRANKYDGSSADDKAADTIYIVKADKSDTTFTVSSTETSVDITGAESVSATPNHSTHVINVTAKGIFTNDDTVTLTLNLPVGAKLNVNNADVANKKLVLTKSASGWAAAGDIVIKAADEATEQEYTVDVTEVSQDATIASATVAKTSTAGTVTSPATVGSVTYDSAGNTATIDVAAGSTWAAGDTITVTLTKNDSGASANASVTLTAKDDGSGNISFDDTEVTVTAEDTNVTVVYTISVTIS